MDSLDPRRGIILTGDFNVHFLLNSVDAQMICNLFASYGLSRVVSRPSRKNACLDNIFTNLNNNFHYEIIDPNMSDHSAISFKIQYDSTNKFLNNKVRVSYKPITDLGLFNLHQRISTVDWSFIDNVEIPADRQFGIFLDLIGDACDISFPDKTKITNSGDCGRVFRIHWFDDELKQMREILKFLTRLSESNPSLVPRKMLKSFRLQYRTKIEKKKSKPIIAILAYQVIKTKLSGM